MKLYYILDNTASLKNDLPPGPRIKVQNLSLGYIKYEKGDGPFKSLKELKKNSTIYKKLQKVNPKRAQKIFDKKYIINVTELIPFPDTVNNTLDKKAFELLSHIISGKTKDKRAHGAHLFNPVSQRIQCITKEPNEKGVWEAVIEIKDSNQDKWIKKETPSTFFPSNWSKGELLLKLAFAYSNKTKVSINKFVGMTECGIKVIFVQKNEVLTSAYPIYD